MKRPTLDDVAERARVSKSTASLLLRGRKIELFSVQTVARVVKAAEEIGYRPNHTARALATGKTQNVALWTFSPFEPFFADVVGQVEKCMADVGLELMIRDAGRLRDEQVRLAQWAVDGLLTMDCGLVADKIDDVRGSRAVPMVSMGTHVTSGADDSVRVDMVPAFVEAARHLADMGCRRIAWVARRTLDNEQPADSHLLPREACFAEWQARGIEVLRVYSEGNSYQAGHQAMAAFLGAGGKADAVFCRTDELAIGALRAIGERGLRVPHDMRVVGCNGIPETAYIVPPLSTVVIPVADMARQACQFINSRIREKGVPPRHVVLPARFEVRGSSLAGK